MPKCKPSGQNSPCCCNLFKNARIAPCCWNLVKKRAKSVDCAESIWTPCLLAGAIPHEHEAVLARGPRKKLIESRLLLPYIPRSWVLINQSQHLQQRQTSFGRWEGICLSVCFMTDGQSVCSLVSWMLAHVPHFDSWKTRSWTLSNFESQLCGSDKKEFNHQAEKNVRVTAGPASHYYWKKTGCFATFLPCRAAWSSF